MPQLPAMLSFECDSIEICHCGPKTFGNKIGYRHTADADSYRRCDIVKRIHRIYFTGSEIETARIKEGKYAMAYFCDNAAIGRAEMRARGCRGRYHIANLGKREAKRPQKFKQKCRGLGFCTDKFCKPYYSAFEISSALLFYCFKIYGIGRFEIRHSAQHRIERTRKCGFQCRKNIIAQPVAAMRIGSIAAVSYECEPPRTQILLYFLPGERQQRTHYISATRTH